jgi:hypothetical protein
MLRITTQPTPPKAVKPNQVPTILRELLARHRHREAVVHLAYLWYAHNEYQYTKSPRILEDFGYALREARAWDRFDPN